jgi:hypothetical protein
MKEVVLAAADDVTIFSNSFYMSAWRQPKTHT